MPPITSISRPAHGIYHPTLSSYYPHLLSLRQYLEYHLIHLGYVPSLFSPATSASPGSSNVGNSSSARGDELEDLLDTTLVASDQVLSENAEVKMLPGEMYFTQQEMVDRALVTIARRPGKLNELSVLSAGFRRSDAFQGLAPNIQRLGLDSHQKNSLVVVLVQGKEWIALHSRLGTDVMIHLLTSPHLSLYLGLLNNCYTQLSGKPLYLVEPMIKVQERELKRKRLENKEREREEKKCKKRKYRNSNVDTGMLCDKPGCPVPNTTKVEDVKEAFIRPPIYVEIVRNRMFYGKWGYRGDKRLPGVGLPIGHILNNLEPPVKIRKLPSSSEDLSKIPRGHHDPHWAARTFLRYLFPREHGLHNVFTSPPGTGGSNEEILWQPDGGKDRYGHWKAELGKAGGYRNYESRKEEIEAAIAVKDARTPKRMKKGEGMDMARRIIARHRKCDYRRIRDAYCPTRTKNNELPANTQGAAACTISPSQVSRFVLAVCRFVFPASFWGSEYNNGLIRKQIITFIKARRYETLSLHQIMQEFKINDCAWLAAGPSGSKISVDEALKRRDLVHELIYWFFDGFLVPLLKTTFYITETSDTKYRTTYFRQDDWAALCEPMLKHLTNSVYCKVDEGRQRYLRKQKPPHATIRLIPKPNGMRPICNLGKKQRVVAASGAVLVRPSINDKLADAHQALTYEKERHAHLLSSSLFGLYDIYGRLKSYKAHLKEMYGDIPKLYFVKMDIKAAFDSLNQKGLLLVTSEILRRDEDYISKKHVQMLPLSGRAPLLWRKQAHPESHEGNFATSWRDLSQKIQNAIFIDQAEQHVQRRKSIVKELFEHITTTHIRFGKDYYLQDTGIPQGSKVSSLLCSYFFGHMENSRYKFTSTEDCLLMRIIDDFLFITPDKAKAELFLKQMNRGSSSYGCHVALSKSLCNFVSEQSLPIPMSEVDQPFPYCGTLIDPKNLDLKIDVTRSYKTHVREILSVKSTRSQGNNFAAWLKRMLENHNHIIYNDTALSSPEAVWSNIYTNFLLTAMKTVHYLDQLQSKLRMNYQFICDSIDRSIEHTANANRAHLKSHVGQQHAAECTVSSDVFTWIAKHAFERIFGHKGEVWEPVQMAMKEDLGRARYKTVRRDRRLQKTLGVTWSAVAKVPF